MIAILSARRLVRPLLVAAALTVSAPAIAQEGPSGAAIQWAQQILDEAGFYNGRAHGRMDAATAAAISKYQQSVGLKATGRLDQSTIDRMLADRQAKETPTMGNLADPGARAKPSAPILKEKDVVPQAAPSAPSVQVERGAEIPAAGPAIGTPSIAPGVAGESQPEAAARAGVEVEGGAPAEPAFDLRNLTAPGWVRYALLGTIAGILVMMALVWAFSGRRKTSAKRAGGKGPKGAARNSGGPVRQAPTLTPPPAVQPGGRRDPFFPSSGGQTRPGGQPGLRGGRL